MITLELEVVSSSPGFVTLFPFLSFSFFFSLVLCILSQCYYHVYHPATRNNMRVCARYELHHRRSLKKISRNTKTAGNNEQQTLAHARGKLYSIRTYIRLNNKHKTCQLGKLGGYSCVSYPILLKMPCIPVFSWLIVFMAVWYRPSQSSALPCGRNIRRSRLFCVQFVIITLTLGQRERVLLVAYHPFDKMVDTQLLCTRRRVSSLNIA